jgi:hypothetical protein
MFKILNIKKILSYINIILFAAILITLISSFFITPTQESIPATQINIPAQKNLKIENLNHILSLEKNSEIPEILFYGSNQRPDKTKNTIFMGIKNSKQIFQTEHNTVFLKCEDKQYALTNEKTKTPLKLSLDKEKLSFVLESQNFVLSRADYYKITNQAWQINKWRADQTILARQQARLFGEDLFMNIHGGKEHSYCQGRLRLEFNYEKKTYCCFIKSGDMLVWENEKWTYSKNTENKPALYVVNIDEKLASLELWDADGKSRINLSLVRLADAPFSHHFSQNIKFLGAKTWKESVLEIDKKRVLVHPHDWLIYSEKGWYKINSTKEIEEYVSGQMLGELLVIDNIKRDKGNQVLQGHIFNKTRTQVKPISIKAGEILSLNEEENNEKNNIHNTIRF